jgi:hypothetical protein
MAMRSTIPGLLLALGTSLALAPDALAQTTSPRPIVCAEGRAIGGACVRPEAARAARMRAIVLSQPRLSLVASPLPLTSMGRARGEEWVRAYRFTGPAFIPSPNQPAGTFTTTGPSIFP